MDPTVLSSLNLAPTQAPPQKSKEDLILEKLAQLESKLDVVVADSTSNKRRSRWTFWLTIIFVVLPIVLSIFFIPYLASSYLSQVMPDTEGVEAPSSIPSLDSLNETLRLLQEAESQQ